MTSATGATGAQFCETQRQKDLGDTPLQCIGKRDWLFLQPAINMNSIENCFFSQ